MIANLPQALQIPVARALERLGVPLADFDRALALAVANDAIDDISRRRAPLLRRLGRLGDQRMARAALKLKLLHLDDAANRAMDRALARIAADLPKNGAPGG